MKLLKVVVLLVLFLALWVTAYQPKVLTSTTSTNNTTTPGSPTENTKTPETPPLVEGIQVGNLAPDFQLPDLDGKPVSLNSLRGKPILINFWATWCPNCREEMPLLQQIYDVWSAKGLVQLEIDVGEGSSQVNSFFNVYQLSMPVLLDAKSDVAKEYGIAAIPTTYFIDKDGIILGKFIGAFANKEVIERYLNQIVP